MFEREDCVPDRVHILAGPVTFVLCHHQLHREVVLPGDGDEAPHRLDRTTGVMLAMDHEQRRLQPVRVVDRGAIVIQLRPFVGCAPEEVLCIVLQSHLVG